jgi:hypothetical protein
MVAIETLLKDRHPYNNGEWIVIPEFPNGTGGTRSGSIDIAAFNCWPSTKFYRVAYEVKRSRSDFITELNNPAKRAWVEEHFHEFYFAFDDVSIAKPEEIPDGCGLIIKTKSGDKLKRTVIPKIRDPKQPSTAFWMGLVRETDKKFQKLVSTTYNVEGTEYTKETFQKLVAEEVYKKLEFERSRLERCIKDSEEIETKLANERGALTEPLRALNDIAKGYGWSNKYSNVDIKTEDDVKNLINLAITRKLDKYRNSVVDSSIKLTELAKIFES